MKTQIFCLQFFVKNSSTKKHHNQPTILSKKWRFSGTQAPPSPIAPTKAAAKTLHFCTHHPVLCILFCKFCRFFHFQTNAFSKIVNAKFFCGVDFFEPSTAKISHFGRKPLYISHLQTPLKMGVFSTANTFFSKDPLFLGVKSPHFLKTRPKLLTIRNLLESRPTCTTTSPASSRRATGASTRTGWHL